MGTDNNKRKAYLVGSGIASLSQFAELPDDVVFTVEYSVRTAQVAVFGLLDVEREVSPFYKGQHDPSILFDALKMLHRK